MNSISLDSGRRNVLWNFERLRDSMVTVKEQYSVNGIRMKIQLIQKKMYEGV